MDEATWIQCAFPSEPSWSAVSDTALIQLVKTYENSQESAESALIELKDRGYPETENLCCDLLSSNVADKWLQAGALGILLSLNPIRGFDVALDLIDQCEFELVEQVIEALNYEHQGSLSEIVHNHPIVKSVMTRLAQTDGVRTEFDQLFIKNFGAS
jgi:hypothetical protein